MCSGAFPCHSLPLEVASMVPEFLDGWTLTRTENTRVTLR